MLPTQKEFFPELAHRTGMKQKDVKKLYNEMIDMIIDSMNSADETFTMIPRLGLLHAKPKEGYMSVNPKNGKPVMVDNTRRVHLKLKPSLKKKASDGYINR